MEVAEKWIATTVARNTMLVIVHIPSVSLAMVVAGEQATANLVVEAVDLVVEAVEEDASLVSLVVEVVLVVVEDLVEDLLLTSSLHLGVVFLLLMVHQRPSRSKVFHIIGVPSAVTGTKLMSLQLMCVVLLPLEIMVMILIALLLQILSWIHLRGWSLKDGILVLVTTIPVKVARAVIFTATAWSIQPTVAIKFLQLECAPVVETMASMPTFATVEEVFLKRLLFQVMRMMMVLMMRSQLSARPVQNSSHLESCVHVLVQKLDATNHQVRFEPVFR